MPPICSRMRGVRAGLVAVGALVSASCGSAPQIESDQSLVVDEVGTVLSGCVDEFDARRDYFPAKAELEDAELFRLTYHGSYKLLDVDAAGAPGGVARYVLVQCGAPLPAEHADRIHITVPAQRLAVTHSYLQEALVLLGAVDRLVGVQRAEYAAAPEIRAGMAAGEILAVGSGHHADIELISALEPDAVLVYEPFFAESDRLLDLGIPVIASSDGRETTMLGATEWMMLVASLLNREADMAQILEETRGRYAALAERVSDIEDRPTFIVTRPYRGTWYLPGGRGSWARLIEDAGGRYVFRADTTAAGREYPLEAVIDRASEIDTWIGVANASSIGALVEDEPRVAALEAVRLGSVWANDGATTPDGYNPYWEHRLPYPDRMLADLIAALHPDRLPDHELIYMRRLPQQEGGAP
ncbi:MAG: ABC transporter substrate-binding protein [Gemmatimonadota bacterium]